jgi:hypothetical protein
MLAEIKANDSNSMFAYCESGFITTQIFEPWAQKVLFPDIIMAREQFEYPGSAHLLLDGYSCHLSDMFLDDCIFFELHLHYLPPHSSDQTQPLDLGIFGLQKMEASRIRFGVRFNPQTEQLLPTLGGFRKAATPYNVTLVFRVARICSRYSQCHETLLTFIDRKAAVNIGHWKTTKTRISIDSQNIN